MCTHCTSESVDLFKHDNNSMLSNNDGCDLGRGRKNEIRSTSHGYRDAPVKYICKTKAGKSPVCDVCLSSKPYKHNPLVLVTSDFDSSSGVHKMKSNITEQSKDVADTTKDVADTTKDVADTTKDVADTTRYISSKLDSLNISHYDLSTSDAGSCTDVSEGTAELKEQNSPADGSELDTEESSVEGSDTEQSSTNSQKTSRPAACQQTTKARHSKKRLLKNLIPNLRRSQSVGSEGQLVPEHALALEQASAAEHDKEESTVTGIRPTVHKTCSADAAMMAVDLPVNPHDYIRHKHKSSIAQNMREKLQKLKRRNTDSLLGGVFLGVRRMAKISPADALEWASSFESLLSDKNGLEMFRDFLKSEFSEENIEFWIACEEIKTIRTNRLVHQVHKIYSEYIAIKAPKQINLDSKTRLETVANLEHPTRDIFNEAQKRIQFLMENDSYKRFLESEPYRSLVQKTSHVKDS